MTIKIEACLPIGNNSRKAFHWEPEPLVSSVSWNVFTSLWTDWKLVRTQVFLPGCLNSADTEPALGWLGATEGARSDCQRHKPHGDRPQAKVSWGVDCSQSHKSSLHITSLQTHLFFSSLSYFLFKMETWMVLVGVLVLTTSTSSMMPWQMKNTYEYLNKACE